MVHMQRLLFFCPEGVIGAPASVPGTADKAPPSILQEALFSLTSTSFIHLCPEHRNGHSEERCTHFTGQLSLKG